MKTLLCLLIILLLNLRVYAQTVFSDQTKTVKYDTIVNLTLEPLNREIFTIPKNDEILLIETPTIKLDNISSCLILLEISILDSKQRELIYTRLENFAEYFCSINEPIIILGNGMNSVENARKLNQEKQDIHLKYISLGNSCLGNNDEEIGIERFNKRTESITEKK